jgi:hypothetical protein
MLPSEWPFEQQKLGASGLVEQHKLEVSLSRDTIRKDDAQVQILLKR